EWPVLERLATWPHPRGVLAAIAFALTDYRLAQGGAEAYWADVAALLGNDQLGSAAALVKMIQSLIARPVSTLNGGQKVARVQRMLRSTFVQVTRAKTIEQWGQDPVPLWHSLADAMGQTLDMKTIVFSMKVFNLFHRISTGRYAAFGDEM